MKRIAVFLVVLLCIFSSRDYDSAALNEMSRFAAIATYRDIPGVTEAEISAIEALKSARTTFSYGALRTTEAFTLPDGSLVGFTPRLCDLLSGLFGIRFVPEIDERVALIAKLDSRSLDFTGELTLTEARQQKYIMSAPIAERMLRIFTRADSHKIQTETDIIGCRIGFLEGTATADAVRTAYPESFTRVNVDSYQTAVRMIQSGEIDAFIEAGIADPVFARYDFIRSALFFPMVYKPVSMTTANPELAPVISVLNRYIAAGGLDRLFTLYKEGDFEYAKYKLDKALTREERAYIAQLNQRGGAVGVAFEHDNYPVNFYNETEKAFQGIAVDVLAEISRLTGIRFEAATTRYSTWPEMFDKAKAGKIPMVAQLLHSEARKEHFIWGAVPYSRSRYAILSKADYPNLAAYQVMRATVGVVSKSGFEDIYRELFPENDNLKLYNTLEECLNALERGDVPLLMASEHMLLSQTNYREKSGFKINVKLSAPMDSYFGFHKDEKILCSIVDKAQQYVQIDMIETDWTGRMFDYSTKLTKERSVLLAATAGALSVILAITLFLFARNLILSRKLREIASKDGLTGALTRRYFLEFGLMQIERSSRLGNECFIILLDLDHFKSINDNYGHLAGDQVLKEIARRVKKAIRPYDLFGRFGGEEFIVLMPDLDQENVLTATERIRLAVCSTPVEFEGRGISVSASFGIVCATRMHDMDTATRCADEALYRAKSEGRNRAVLYS